MSIPFQVLKPIAIYPHKGTETNHGQFTDSLHNIAIYPRKGTETAVVFDLDLVRDIAIYPRKGTKKHLCHWHLPAAEVLIFYFTGWELRLPESSL